jgi:hypothetical protein
MKKKIIRFLEKQGYDPREDGDYILFTRKQIPTIKETWDAMWFQVYKMPKRKDYSIRIGAIFRDDEEKRDRTLLLASVNIANGDSPYLNIHVDYYGNLNVENRNTYRTIKSFKKDFQLNCLFILGGVRNVKEIYDIIASETAYDKIHFHLTQRAIPYMISEVKKRNRSAMLLGNIRTLQLLLKGRDVSEEDVQVFPWKEIQITQQTQKDGKCLLIYTFPEPRRFPQAKFALVFLDADGRPIEYINLLRMYKRRDIFVERKTPELNPDYYWLLSTTVRCGDGSHTHFNYAKLEGELSLDNFLQSAKNVISIPQEQREYYFEILPTDLE